MSAELQVVTSVRIEQTGDWSEARFLQVQLRVEKLSVSFSWQQASGDVDIINSAVTMEPSVHGYKWIGRLEHT